MVGSPVECASALAKLEREAILGSTAVTLALGQLATIRAAWHEVQPLDNVRQIAQRPLCLTRCAPPIHSNGQQHCLPVSIDSKAGDRVPGCPLESGAERERFNVARQFSD